MAKTLLAALSMLIPSGGSPTGTGTAVSEMSASIWVVFQASNSDYCFGSDGQGAYRYDGKTIVRFTTVDGLSGDRVREFREDKSGNIFVGTLTGISRFDGKGFTTLTPVESTDWRLDSDDLWFKGDSMVDGPYRYDGKTLHHLRFPKSDLEDEFNRNNPKRPWSPYAVYTIYRDSRGHLWFGTAAFGLCRYDGKSFGWLYERELSETPKGGSFGIRSIREDKHGKFWINNNAQRFVVSPEPGVIRYQKVPGVDLPKGQAWYNGITKDERQNLWMSSYETGVWRYDGEKLMNFPVKDALAVSIYTDNRGEVWLGTQESGVYRLKGEAFEKFRP